jgi:hypothetical protein
VPFTLKSGEWENLTVRIPDSELMGILRIYLPAQNQPVELDWIELQSDAAKRRWDF